jgi:hypothetical protein
VEGFQPNPSPSYERPAHRSMAPAPAVCEPANRESAKTASSELVIPSPVCLKSCLSKLGCRVLFLTESMDGQIISGYSNLLHYAPRAIHTMPKNSNRQPLRDSENKMPLRFRFRKDKNPKYDEMWMQLVTKRSKSAQKNPCNTPNRRAFQSSSPKSEIANERTSKSFKMVARPVRPGNRRSRGTQAPSFAFAPCPCSCPRDPLRSECTESLFGHSATQPGHISPCTSFKTGVKAIDYLLPVKLDS